jgi:multisite-specific tRNA:(cytosine-C5)-methyltransferase
MGQKRLATANVKTLRTLMSSLTVPLVDLEEGEFRSQMEAMEPGSCVLIVEAKGEGVS